MPDYNKTEEFLQRLTPCIERSELEACVEEAARVAREMGVGAPLLLDLSSDLGSEGKDDFAYVLALAAAQGLEGEDKAQAYSNAGLAARSLGKNEKAEEHYKKAIEADPKLAMVHSNYAILLAELNRKYEAEEHYKKAIELEPKFVSWYFNYAIFLRNQKLFIDAENMVRTSIKIEPTNFHAHTILGEILSDEEYFEMAEEEYHEALMNSDSIENALALISKNHNKLGYVYYQLKLYGKAKREFKKAIDFDPMNMKARDNLQKVNKKIKKIEDSSAREISKKQIFSATVVFAYLIVSFYLFLTTTKFTGAEFIAQLAFLIILLFLILFYPQFKTLEFGPSGIKVDKSEPMSHKK